MLPLLCAIIVFFFLVVGAVVFLLCTLIPPARRYALSAALWCAVWGPCSVALLLFAGAALIAQAFITQHGDAQSFHAPRLLSVFGWGYLIAGTLLTAAVATAVAWLHQFIVRRFTFALFRLYATIVTAGIGSVFGWCFTWWMLVQTVSFTWLWSLLVMLFLIASFGFAAFKGAKSLRGKAPTDFAWITPEEFTGA
jgi:hypothetical protein